jgi:hypothetical protein
MTPQDFCYWLEGYIKNSDPDRPYKQIQDIKDNLDIVFNGGREQEEEEYSRNVPRGYYNIPRYSYHNPVDLDTNTNTNGHSWVY